MVPGLYSTKQLLLIEVDPQGEGLGRLGIGDSNNSQSEGFRFWSVRVRVGGFGFRR